MNMTCLAAEAGWIKSSAVTTTNLTTFNKNTAKKQKGCQDRIRYVAGSHVARRGSDPTTRIF
jgi:hypothetical protein